MLNDFFTQAFLERLRQRLIRLGPWIGVLLLILIVYSTVGRFQTELTALDRISTEDQSLTLLEALVQLTPTQTPTLDPNATKAVATATPEPIPETPAPELVVSAMTKTGCGGCHIIPGVSGAIGQVGPDLTTLGTVASERRPDYTAEAYIYESIVDPEAFIAPDCPTGACPSGIMVAALSATLNDGEIEAMVDYLLTLTEE